MATVYNSKEDSVFPRDIDQHLQVPASPTVARLSEAEAPDDYGQPYATNTHSHTDLHHAENNAIKKLEMSVICDDSINVIHDHSDAWNADYNDEHFRLHPSNKHGRHLLVQNSHTFTDHSYATTAQSSKPDSDLAGIHHSLGDNDDLGDYQAVSGKLWKKKNLPDVPDSMFDNLNRLPDRWDTTVAPYPGDNLADILVALLGVLHTHNTELDKYGDAIAKINKTLASLIEHIWGDVKINSDGSINWGKGINMLIPQGDLNIFSGGTAGDNVYSNAIRTRNTVTDNDIRTK